MLLSAAAFDPWPLGFQVETALESKDGGTESAPPSGADGGTAIPEKADPDPLLPVRAADRAPTLPRQGLRVDVDLGLSRQPSGAQTWDSVIGAGFGLSAAVEVGGQLLPLTLSPRPTVGDPLLYGSYVLAPGDWTVVPTIQLTLPTRTGTPWAFDAVVAISTTVKSRLTFSASPNVSLTLARPAAVTVTLPVAASLQVDQRAQLGVLSGIGFARFDPRRQTARVVDSLDLNEATGSLGATAIYTVGRDDGPFVDIGVQFFWPTLVAFGRAPTGASAGDWSVLLTTSTFYRL